MAVNRAIPTLQWVQLLLKLSCCTRVGTLIVATI